jgi:hypothetical protein
MVAWHWLLVAFAMGRVAAMLAFLWFTRNMPTWKP